MSNKLTAPDYFEKILSKIQGHIYWKNTKSEYQWCNDLQAIDAGLKNREEIVGLTDYDMPWHEDADFLREIDLQVIQTCSAPHLNRTTKQTSLNIYNKSA